MIRFCLGVVMVAFWPSLAQMAALLLVLSVLALLHRALFNIGPLLLGLAWGIGYGYWALAHYLPTDWEGRVISVTGHVVGLPRIDGDKCRIDIVPQRSERPDKAALTALLPTTWAPRRLRLTEYRCHHRYRAGQRWQLQVKLKRPHGGRNPGVFDYEAYLMQQGIDATGYILPGARQLSQPVTCLSAGLQCLSRLREKVADNIDQLVRSRGGAGLLKALLIGDRRGVSKAQWLTLRNSGTVHLLVISGMHVGVIAAMIFAVVSKTLRLFPRLLLQRQVSLAAWSALLATGVYSLLAGFSLPAQRAWIMIAVWMLSLVCFRRVGAFRRLLLGLGFVLMLDPLAIRSPGFWLSFSAVATLLYLFCCRCRALRSEGRWEYWSATWRAQLGVFLVLAPLTVVFFQQVAWSAPVINLVAIPFITLLVLPLAFGSLLLVPVWPSVAAGGLNAAAYLLDMSLAGLQVLLATWDLMWIAAAPSGGSLFLAAIGAWWFMMPRGLSGRWLAVLLFFPLFMPVQQLLPMGGYRATVLDVGQGLAVLVETRHRRLLYDTGPRFGTDSDAGERVVIPFLRDAGIAVLNKTVISHADSDHAGGLASLREQMVIGQLISGMSSQVGGNPCHAPQRWWWDGVLFEFINPVVTGKVVSNNNRSCVLRVGHLSRSALLLTGDIDQRSEKALLARGVEVSASVLVAGHHGSASSSAGEFLAAVAPSWVVYSSGYRNRWRHPDAAVRARVAAYGARELLTSEQGAVRITHIPGQPIRVEGYRSLAPRYWWQ